MEDRETARMRKYGESKTTRIMMATVPHVTSGLGLRKFQADEFLLIRVYNQTCIISEVLPLCYQVNSFRVAGPECYGSSRNFLFSKYYRMSSLTHLIIWNDAITLTSPSWIIPSMPSCRMWFIYTLLIGVACVGYFCMHPCTMMTSACEWIV